MYEEDLALSNLQWLICHKTKPNQTKQSHTNMYQNEEQEESFYLLYMKFKI